jgi:hypothetical protein
MSECRRVRHGLGVLGLLVLLALRPDLLAAQDSTGSINGIYKGIIGRQAVVAEIGVVAEADAGRGNPDTADGAAGSVEGRYFYRRHGVDIRLAGRRLEDGTLVLREYRLPGGFDDELAPEWRLTIRGSSANGAFCKCDSSRQSKHAMGTLTIHLRRVSQQFHPQFDPNADTVYDRLLLDFPLQDGPEIMVDPHIAYVMRSDPRFGVARPRLTRLPDEVVMARINADMATELNWDRLKAAGTLSEAREEVSSGGFYDELTTVNFFPPAVMSARVGRSWYWGGAHPNNSGNSENYDLRSGKRFSLRNALRTARGSKAEEDVAAMLARLYKRHYVKPPRTAAAEDCYVVLNRVISDGDLVDAFSPNDGILFMSHEGLVISPIFKYADSGCAPDITVPYSEVRPFVRTDSLLNWVARREMPAPAQSTH